MTQYEIEQLWVKNQLDVVFRFGEKVRIRTGETGRIVALIALEPFPLYVIEFPDETSANAIESEIEKTQ